MQLKFNDFVFAVTDHCWLASTSPKDYEADPFCPRCQCHMDVIARIVSGQDTGLTTGICPQCGFIKRTNNMNEESIAEHFSYRWLKDRTQREGDRVNPTYDAYNALAPFLHGKEMILDLGCGNGCSMIPFREKGYNIRGVEPSQARSQRAREYFGGLVETGFAESFLSGTRDKFDVIYSENVLQFVKDPFMVLELSAEKISDGGIMSIRAQEFDYSDFAFFSLNGVIRSFLSLYCLRDFIEKHGFNILYYSRLPFLIVLKKEGKINDRTRRILDRTKKVTAENVKKKAMKDLLSIGSRLTSRISIRKKSMKRTMNFALLSREPVLPVMFHSRDGNLPLLLK